MRAVGLAAAVANQLIYRSIFLCAARDIRAMEMVGGNKNVAHRIE